MVFCLTKVECGRSNLLPPHLPSYKSSRAINRGHLEEELAKSCLCLAWYLTNRDRSSSGRRETLTFSSLFEFECYFFSSPPALYRGFHRTSSFHSLIEQGPKMKMTQRLDIWVVLIYRQSDASQAYPRDGAEGAEGGRRRGEEEQMRKNREFNIHCTLTTWGSQHN